jgi:uncharacterized protein (TIGR01777 family)
VSSPRRVFVTGATGLVGRSLCAALAEAGDVVIAQSRSPRVGGTEGPGGVRWVQSELAAGNSPDGLEGCDAVIHLAGEPIAGGRWSAARKRRLVESRVDTTRALVAAIARLDSPPAALLCASATGVYGPRQDELLSEASPAGQDFLSRLCVDWEAEAQRASEQGVRVVCLRFGPVLSAAGGALAPMARAFRWGVGGPLGPPGSWFPWIHEEDATRLVRYALDGPLSGPVNLVSPQPSTMGDFSSALGRALRRPAWLRTPLPLMRLAMGEMASALVPGQRVVPAVALDAGFEFRHPDLDEALRSCLGGRG